MRFYWPLIWPCIFSAVNSQKIECSTCPDTCVSCSCMLAADGTELRACLEAPDREKISIHDLHDHDHGEDHGEDECDDEYCVEHIGVTKNAGQWPKIEGLSGDYNREILWTYSPSTTDQLFIKNVHIAMEELQKDLLCVKLTYKKFNELTKDDEHGILFQEGDSCVSWVGYVPGKSVSGSSGDFRDAVGSNWTGGTKWQNIQMHYESCQNSIDSFQHEVLHALGLVHEFDRPDREDFIQIIPDAAKGATIDMFAEALSDDEWVKNDKAGFQIESCILIGRSLMG